MNISTYQDGERFVVVFEGIDVSEKDMIKGMLNPFVVNRTPEVKPVESKEQKPAADRFSCGPYEGKTPQEILSGEPKEARDAYTYLTGLMDTFEVSFKEICESALKEYLRNSFKSVDPETYANKLSEKQMNNFFEIYKYSLPENVKKTKSGVVESIKAFKG